MSAVADAKAAARTAAFAARREAHGHVDPASAHAALAAALAPWRGRVLAGYVPIRTEIDPTPVMAAWSATAPVCVPVVDGPGLPLRFRAWRPGVAMVAGPFGVQVPAGGDWLAPEVLIVPMLAFDAGCLRLGYGGGFYDRTLARLRAAAPVAAIGLAYGAQRLEALPAEPTDQRLDAIVTEAGILGRVPQPLPQVSARPRVEGHA